MPRYDFRKDGVDQGPAVNWSVRMVSPQPGLRVLKCLSGACVGIFVEDLMKSNGKKCRRKVLNRPKRGNDGLRSTEEERGRKADVIIHFIWVHKSAFAPIDEGQFTAWEEWCLAEFSDSECPRRTTNEGGLWEFTIMVGVPGIVEDFAR